MATQTREQTQTTQEAQTTQTTQTKQPVQTLLIDLTEKFKNLKGELETLKPNNQLTDMLKGLEKKINELNLDKAEKKKKLKELEDAAKVLKEELASQEKTYKDLKKATETVAYKTADLEKLINDYISKYDESVNTYKNTFEQAHDDALNLIKTRTVELQTQATTFPKPLSAVAA